MRPQKFNHMRGGKILGLILFGLCIVLIVVVFLVFRDMHVEPIAAISLLLSVGAILWVTYKFYKPAFTQVTFFDEGIVSKTHFEQENLSINDIKGIWYYKNTQDSESEIIPYSEGDNLKGCVIVIGDIDYFTDVDYAGLNGTSILCGTFKKGYTTLLYRKELEEVLRTYHHKIQNKS